jgi:hypothetical protein
MKIQYYEMHPDYSPNQYLYIRSSAGWENNEPFLGPVRLMYTANRAWLWDIETDCVEFVKNRDTGIMTPVDRREFLMVQLQAVEWKNETA